MTRREKLSLAVAAVAVLGNAATLPARSFIPPGVAEGDRKAMVLAMSEVYSVDPDRAMRGCRLVEALTGPVAAGLGEAPQDEELFRYLAARCARVG